MEFHTSTCSYQEDNKGLRIGQFFMNELSKYDLEIYRSVPADLDCYYDDKLLGVCSERWGRSSP